MKYVYKVNDREYEGNSHGFWCANKYARELAEHTNEHVCVYKVALSKPKISIKRLAWWQSGSVFDLLRCG